MNTGYKEQSTPGDYLNSLMLRNNVSIKAMYDYENGHREEIKNIKNIFNLENSNDRKLCLCLLEIMAQDQKNEMVRYFCEENKVHEVIDEIFLKKNTPLLITAMALDTAFFSMAWNLCGFIRQMVNGENESIHIEVIAASDGSDSEEKVRITKKDIDIHNPEGKLKLYGKNSEVYFTFKFDKIPETPCIFEIRCVTSADKKEHVVSLYKETVDDDILQSDFIDNFIYENGFDITGWDLKLKEQSK
jgi:hypothetical protein